MIEVTRIFYLVFGLLTIVGGTIGFLKARSRASLIAGGTAGLVLIAAGVAIILGYTNPGLITGLLASTALAGQFIPKVIINRAPIHSVVMAILSAAGLILSIIALAEK